MALLRERDVERHLVKRIKALGGQIRKVKWIGRRSAPDRRVMLPGMCFWVEVKAPGLWLTDAQDRERKRMVDAGETYRVFNSIGLIDEALDSYEARRSCAEVRR